MTDHAATLTTPQVMTLSAVVPVLVIETLADAVPLARALTAGGLYAIEVTLRTACALEAIKAIGEEVPEAVVGAGTVLNGRQYDQAVAAGARFIVSPGLTDGLIAAAASSSAPILPGIANASDLMRGLDAGLTHFKSFPLKPQAGGGDQGPGRPVRRRQVLPHRRHHLGQGAQLSGPVQRAVRRRRLGLPRRSGQRGRVGQDHHAGARGGGAERLIGSRLLA